jgi:uncharacterized protein YndB with AHSA1/START domain
MTLDGERTIVISRAFKTTPEIIYRAWTDPELVKRWWAPRALGVSMVSCEADVKVGGTYRYVLQNPDGGQIAFSGQYVEIIPGRRVVYTQIFEPMAEAGSAELTVTFAAEGHRTLVVSTETYPSAEVRDIVMSSGMEEGMRDTMNQLDELVLQLSAAKAS